MTSTVPRLSVQAFFVHDRLLLDRFPGLSTQLLHDKQRILEHLESPYATQAGAFERLVSTVYANEDLRELPVLFVEGSLEAGQLVTTTQDFYFKKLSESRRHFHGTLGVDRRIPIHGEFSVERIIGTTGGERLSRRRNVSMLADVIAADSRGIELQPLFIGWLFSTSDDHLIALPYRRDLRVYPSQVDQFSQVANVSTPTKADLQKVSSIPEDDVREAFAAIIGEPFIPNHSPAEQSDLFTTRLSLEGQPTSAAVAFKGPGYDAKLTIAGMGKHGNQGVKLAQEPAELLIVQHHREIAADVDHLMQALCFERGKKYMTIDGGWTALILKAYGKL